MKIIDDFIKDIEIIIQLKIYLQRITHNEYFRKKHFLVEMCNYATCDKEVIEVLKKNKRICLSILDALTDNKDLISNKTYEKYYNCLYECSDKQYFQEIVYNDKGNEVNNIEI